LFAYLILLDADSMLARLLGFCLVVGSLSESLLLDSLLFDGFFGGRVFRPGIPGLFGLLLFFPFLVLFTLSFV
jgi:hypothetical protein